MEKSREEVVMEVTEVISMDYKTVYHSIIVCYLK
jgi:hypothetical protein